MNAKKRDESKQKFGTLFVKKTNVKGQVQELSEI